MSVKKNIKSDSPSDTIKKCRTIFVFTKYGSAILWLVFVISVVWKLRTNRGFISWIVFCLWKVEMTHWTFFNPSALLEVAKTIGVFSVFIAWIYAELGKSELGRRYTELLANYCDGYHKRALSYILAILACIYIARIGILESAGFAMMIAVISLVDQAMVLISFIFTPSVRKELAVERWSASIEALQNESDKQKQLSEIYALEDSIGVEDAYCDKLCECLSEAFLTYNIDETDISNIWERLLEGCPVHEESLLLYNILTKIENFIRRKPCEDMFRRRISVCAGYLFWRYRYYSKTVSSESSEDCSALLPTMSDIDKIHQKLHCPYPEITNCLNTVYALFCWMHFLCGNTTPSQELLEFFDHFEPTFDDSYKETFEGCIRCTFKEDICEKYFENAWGQVLKPEERSHL